MLEANSTTVSVWIPTFNGADYLREAIDSMLESDYEGFEIVIADNCSDDQTAAVLDGLLLGGRIRFYKNDRDIRSAGKLNRCLEPVRN